MPAGVATVRLTVAAILLAAATVVSCDQPATSGDATRPIVLATGGTHGVYYQYGRALATRLESAEPDHTVVVRATSGSVENLQLLDRAEATCAFVAGDAAVEAITGRPPFGHVLPIAALARVYDDYLHLATRRDGPIRSLRDLSGRRVSLGPAASGTRLMVDRLLSVAQLAPEQLRVSALGIDESLAALERGDLDAFFWSGGVPTSGVLDLGDRVPLRLVPLNGYAAALRAGFDGVYRAATIPVGVYGLAESVGTVAVPNELICRSDLDAATVELLMRTLFGERETMATSVPQALSLDRRVAIATDPVPLHVAALEWYRRTKP